MNLHNLIAGKNITDDELEERVSSLIGTILLCSMVVNIISVPIAVKKITKK